MKPQHDLDPWKDPKPETGGLHPIKEVPEELEHPKILENDTTTSFFRRQMNKLKKIWGEMKFGRMWEKVNPAKMFNKLWQKMFKPGITKAAVVLKAVWNFVKNAIFGSVEG